MRREEDWHILHFIGHGGFDAETEEGAIALADEVGRKDLLRATSLARLLDDHYPLRLAFLNSCEGARGSESDAFSSTAATLVRRGVPAVVAMQYEVTDKAAIEFSRDFYEAMADGLPVDAAVAEARTAVSMRSALEWGTPVLYMRSPDGRIFDVQQTVDRPGEKEPKFGRFKTLPGWEPESTTSSSFEKDTSARFVMPEREGEPIRFECSEFQADIPIKHTHMFFVYAKRQDFEPIQIGTHDSVEWWWFKGDFYKVEFEPGHPSADLAAKLAADETYADRTSLLDTLPEEGYAPDEVAEGVFEIKGETETALESAERLDIAKAITLQAVEVSRLNELLAVQDTSHDLGLEKDASARVYVDKSWRRTQVCMESDLHQPRQVLVDDDTVFKLIPELQNYHPILLDKKTDRGRLWRSEVIAEWWCFKGDIYLAKREKSYQSEALSLLKEATSRTHLVGKSQAWIPKWTIGNEFEDLYEEGYAPEEVVRRILALEGKSESLEEIFNRVQAAKDAIDEGSNFQSAFQAPWDATRDWFKRKQVEEYLQERIREGSEGLREAREGGYWFNLKEWVRRRS